MILCQSRLRIVCTDFLLDNRHSADDVFLFIEVDGEMNHRRFAGPRVRTETVAVARVTRESPFEIVRPEVEIVVKN